MNKLVAIQYYDLLRAVSLLEWFLDDLGEIIQAQQEDWTANSLTEDVESREKQAERLNDLIPRLKRTLSHTALIACANCSGDGVVSVADYHYIDCERCAGTGVIRFIEEEE